MCTVGPDGVAGEDELAEGGLGFDQFLGTGVSGCLTVSAHFGIVKERRLVAPRKETRVTYRRWDQV